MLYFYKIQAITLLITFSFSLHYFVFENSSGIEKEWCMHHQYTCIYLYFKVIILNFNNSFISYINLSSFTLNLRSHKSI